MTGKTLHALAEAMGVLDMFHDLEGRAHWTNDDTRRALLRAMGIEAGTEAEAGAALDAHRQSEAGRIVPPECVVTAGFACAAPQVDR